MLQFFKINDPYRLLVIFFIAIVFAMLRFFNLDVMSIETLTYVLLGKKIALGSKMYLDIWTDMSPLSNFIYFLIGKYGVIYQITFIVMGILLITFQASYFNYILIKHKVYSENNYVPSLLYIILANIVFDEIIFSPFSISITFVLLAINILLGEIDPKRRNDLNLISLGIFLGLASFAYIPCMLFYFATILILVLFSKLNPPNIARLLFGFFFIFSFFYLYFYWIDGTQVFFSFVFRPFTIGNQHFQFSLLSLLIIGGFPLALFIYSVLKTFNAIGFINYQTKSQVSILLLGIVSLIIWISMGNRSGASFILLVPFFTFFYTHFLLLLRNRFWQELYLLSIILYVLAINLSSQFSLELIPHLNIKDNIVKKEYVNPEWNKKRMIVLGNEISYYKGNYHSTRFFQWSISKKTFYNLDDYSNLQIIMSEFATNKPEIVVDQEGIFPKVQAKIPLLEKMYQKGEPGNIYFLREF